MEPILFICGAKGSYTRNEVLRRVLREIAPDYREIVSERETYAARLADVLLRSLGRRRGRQAFLGFLAQPLSPFFARGASIDFFISLFDTLCLDRRTFAPDGAIGRFLKAYDRWCLGRAGVILTDTEENAGFYAELFGVERKRFTAVPVSADTDRFKPQAPRAPDGTFHVLYYCTFLPLHGAGVVYEAARLLGTESHIRFTIVGKGPTSAVLDRKLESWGLRNVTRLDWVAYDKLAASIAGADLCLGGHFSDNPKAQRVIPGKVFQFLAMARPVILGDAPANRRHFTHLKDSWICDATSPDALARAIWELSTDPKRCETIARNGYLLFQDRFHPEVAAAALGARLTEAFTATPAAPGKP